MPQRAELVIIHDRTMGLLCSEKPLTLLENRKWSLRISHCRCPITGGNRNGNVIYRGVVKTFNCGAFLSESFTANHLPQDGDSLTSAGGFPLRFQRVAPLFSPFLFSR